MSKSFKSFLRGLDFLAPSGGFRGISTPRQLRTELRTKLVTKASALTSFTHVHVAGTNREGVIVKCSGFVAASSIVGAFHG